ncbi:MAG: undecaprenyl-diphosphate phosphatase [Puniceicoccales bacterium]|jgi:undecaprenyl-diphosphatase|nr:undecaprenyl-diphosphate phosphatase [Puniceicoccales bacterium]
MKRFALQTLNVIIMLMAVRPLSAADANDRFLDNYATTLGIIQGATEFLPISSTAHMVIFEQIVRPKHLERDHDAKPNQENQVHGFGTIIQLGSMMAMLLMCSSRIKIILSGIFFFNKEGLALLLKLILGLIPCVIVGLMVNDLLEKFCTLPCLATALATGSLVMLFAEKFYEKSEKISSFNAITYRKAFFIGLCQCFALITGISRSMTTIVGGYLSNLSRSISIEFSFLLGAATIALAATYRLLFSSVNPVSTMPIGCIIKGTLIAFITSLLVMKPSIYILKKYGLYPFAIYRILLAVAIIFLVNFY